MLDTSSPGRHSPLPLLPSSRRDPLSPTSPAAVQLPSSPRLSASSSRLQPSSACPLAAASCEVTAATPEVAAATRPLAPASRPLAAASRHNRQAPTALNRRHVWQRPGRQRPLRGPHPGACRVRGPCGNKQAALTSGQHEARGLQGLSCRQLSTVRLSLRAH